MEGPPTLGVVINQPSETPTHSTPGGSFPPRGVIDQRSETRTHPTPSIPYMIKKYWVRYGQADLKKTNWSILRVDKTVTAVWHRIPLSVNCVGFTLVGCILSGANPLTLYLRVWFVEFGEANSRNMTPRCCKVSKRTTDGKTTALFWNHAQNYSQLF